MYQQIDVEKFRAPGPRSLDSLTELPRVLLELSSLAYTWPILAGASRGDGHRVLVLPGFTAGDDSTLVLRRYLSRLGYRALPWGLGRNTGSFDLQERLTENFRSLAAQCDQPISLVGQSLGGVYARELARQFSDSVRQVISLGSPFGATGPDNASPVVSRLFQYVSGLTAEEVRGRALTHAAEAPPVPSTAIYSKSDGVVHWTACLEYRSEQSENIEVLGSHTGMAVNPLVLHAVADRLGQPKDRWRPFARPGGCHGLLYPNPEPTVNPTTSSEVRACAN